MYTTIRALIDSLDKYKVISMFALKTYEPEIDMYLDKHLPVLLSGRQDGNFMYLVQHPKSRSGANDGLLYSLKDIKILVPQIEEGSFWQCLSEDIDEDGEFLGDADDYEPLIEELWWLESNLPLKLSEPNNLIYVKKLKKETLL